MQAVNYIKRLLSSALPTMLYLLVALCTPTHKHQHDLNIEGGEMKSVLCVHNICEDQFLLKYD